MTVTPVFFTSAGRLRQRGADAVLHLDGGQILVPPDVEGGGDAAGAVAAAVEVR